MAAINKNIVAIVAQSDALLLTFEYDDGNVSADIDMTAITTNTWTVGTRTLVITDATDTYTLVVPTGHPLLDPPAFNNVGYADTPTRLLALLSDV